MANYTATTISNAVPPPSTSIRNDPPSLSTSNVLIGSSDLPCSNKSTPINVTTLNKIEGTLPLGIVSTNDDVLTTGHQRNSNRNENDSNNQQISVDEKDISTQFTTFPLLKSSETKVLRLAHGEDTEKFTSCGNNETIGYENTASLISLSTRKIQISIQSSVANSSDHSSLDNTKMEVDEENAKQEKFDVHCEQKKDNKIENGALLLNDTLNTSHPIQTEEEEEEDQKDNNQSNNNTHFEEASVHPPTNENNDNDNNKMDNSDDQQESYALANCATASVSCTVRSFVDGLRKKRGSSRQVKMFLNDGESEAWNERGVGIFVPELDIDGVVRFVVKSSEDLSVTMLSTRVNENTRYAMQGRTVITWISGSVPTCLSFAHGFICSEVWSILQLTVPERISEDEEDEDEGDEDEDASPTDTTSLSVNESAASAVVAQHEDTEEELQNQFKARDYDDVHNVGRVIIDAAALNSLRTLYHPPQTPEALNECLNGIRVLEKYSSTKPNEATKLLTTMTEPDWLRELWNLLDEAIVKEDFVVCSNIAELLCRLVAIYALTSNPFVGLATKPDCYRVLDPHDPLVRLLSDMNYEQFFKAMEYEPELRKHGVKVNHVEFLKHASQFKEVICSEDPTFRITCHFVYRILYLRDVCLPRHLDEITIQRLSAVINTGYSYLCRIIQLTPGSFASLRQIIPLDVSGARFLLQLLSVLRTNAGTIAEKPHLFAALRNEQVLESLEGYLTEQCPAAREHRRAIRQCLMKQREADEKMASLIETDVGRRHRPHLLSHDRISTQSLPEIAVEILHHVVEYNPGLLRSIILNQAMQNRSNPNDSPPSFWAALCRVFRTSDNEGLHTQLSEIFRRVLDPALMESPERDDFLSIFYDRGVIDLLIDILLTPPPTAFEDLLPSECSSFVYFVPKYLDLFFDNDDDEDENDDGHHNNDEDDGDLRSNRQKHTRVSTNAFNTPRRPFNFSESSSNSTSRTVSVSGGSHMSKMHTGQQSFNKTPTYNETRSRSSCPDLSSSPNSNDRSKSPFVSAPLRRDFDDPGLPPAKRRASASSIDSNRPTPPKRTPFSSVENYTTNSEHQLASSSLHQFLFRTQQMQRSSFMDEPYASISSSTNFQNSPQHRPQPVKLLTRAEVEYRRFLEELSQTAREELLMASRSQLSFVKCQVSEILAFCVMKHNCRIKYRTLQQSLHLQLIQMAFDPVFDQFLAIYAVKFLRACLTAQAEYYARIFIRHDIFAPLLFLLRHRVIPPQSRAEGSLLESVIFEFFTTVRMLAATSAAVTSLLQSLFEKHGNDVEWLDVYYTERCDYTLFKQLRAQYNELCQQTSDRQRRRDYWRGLLVQDDEDEEELGGHNDGKLTTKSSTSSMRSRRPSFSRIASYGDSTFDYERGVQDAYFDVDDEDNEQIVSSSINATDLSNERRQLTEDSNNDQGSKSIFPSSFTSDTTTELPLHPSVCYADMEEDDTDVPDFLRAKPNNTTSISSSGGSGKMPQPSIAMSQNNLKEEKAKLFGLKLSLSSNGHNNLSTQIQ